MPYVEQLIAEKASIINRNKKIYGTFAEIGAGQGTVNHFFKAGLSSQTVAKSMSAYDMVFSDLIYGKSDRYVCEKRLIQMLRHEYSLLENRLKKSRGAHTCFFTLANTVAVSTLKTSQARSHHGWLGLRFQSRPMAKYNEILLHVNLLDRTRLQQHETLGALGVNLIYTAFYGKKDSKNFIRSLVDNFEYNRVEVNIIKCTGSIFKNTQAYTLGLEFLKQNLSPFVVLPYDESPLDMFFEKSLHLITPSSSAPSRKKTQKDLYLTITSYSQKLKQKKCLIHNFKHLYELKEKLREYTQKKIYFYLSFKEFQSFINAKAYKDQNLIQVYGRFFDSQTQMIVLAPKGFSTSCLMTQSLINNKSIQLI